MVTGNDKPPFLSQFAPLEAMTPEELATEIAMWRNLWTWVDEGVKYYLSHIGDSVRIVTRNYKGYEGELGQPTFTLAHVEALVRKVEYNYEEGKNYIELKTVRIPAANIVQLEFLHDKEEKPDLWAVQAVEQTQETVKDVVDEQIASLLRGESNNA